MRLLGALLIFFLVFFVGRNSGSIVVYLEVWAIIGIVAIIMTIVGIFLSLPLMVHRYSSYEENSTEKEAESLLKSNMFMCASIGFIAGSFLGALLASVVIS